MRLASKVHSDSHHRVTIIDTTTEQRIAADSRAHPPLTIVQSQCPSTEATMADGIRPPAALLQESMRMNGVELQQLMPRLEKDFDDGTTSDEIVKVRYQTFDKVRLELLNMVLETRRDLEQVRSHPHPPLKQKEK